MKRLFLLVSLLSAFLYAVAEEYDYPTLTDNSALVGKYSPVANPVAHGTDGTIYQTGLFDDMVMIGDDILEPVATSAYISAINPAAKTFKWTVGIQGAARITAITADENGVYVTGIFADDITLGSKDMNTKSYTGTVLSHEKVNGFVAKYSLDGNLLYSQTVIPHKLAKYDESEYESDLMVFPTSIATFNGKVYVSMTFCGGYEVDGLSTDGNVKSSFGYWDNKCADVIVFASADLSGAKCIYDIRNSQDVNTNGLAPSSICLATDGNKLYIGTFAPQACKETVLTTDNEYPECETGIDYNFILTAIDKTDGISQNVKAANSDRAYINNVVKKMSVDGGKIYVAGCVSSPLPFNTSLTPDLWCDEFAACLNASTFDVQWSSITAAKRDDMSTTNEKYREATDATLTEGKYVVVGSTNFACDAEGKQSDFSSDYLVGIADNGSSLAVTSKTDTGSKVTVTTHASGIKSVTAEKTTDGQVYDLSGRRLYAEPKGQIYIKSAKKIINH